MPLVELVRVVVRLRIVVVELNLLRFLFGSASSALALSGWTRRAAVLCLPRWTQIVVRFIEVEFLSPLQRIVLCGGLDDLGHRVVLLLVSRALRRLPVADSSVHLLLLAITALVLFDFGCNFSSRVLSQVRIADELELKEVPQGLLKLRFDLCGDVTAPLDSFLKGHGYGIQVLVNWVDWLGGLVKCSQLLFAQIHHVVILVCPRVMAATIGVLTIVKRICARSILAWLKLHVIWVATIHTVHISVSLWHIVVVWVRIIVV